MKKIGSHFAALYYFLRYLISGRHRKGHGVHSPFVFDFISKVLHDRSKYPEYQFFDSVRDSLRLSDEILQVGDIGENSVHFNKKNRKVGDLARISSIPAKYGRLLFRIVRYYKPVSIVELGTSIGISSMYLAKGNTKSKVLTVEGNTDLCDYASALFFSHRIGNISVLNRDFDQAIIELPVDYVSPQLVFIDGNHSYEPTMRYYKFFMEGMKEGILIFDDIYWSAGMRKAWKEIIQRNKEYVTIDLYRMGIIIFRESVTPGHFVVRF
jgi:predicted O-methyltransferase YrrM